MNILIKIWRDPVWSKVIAVGAIGVISFIISKCKFKFTKLNRKKLFIVLSTKPIQKANHSCITIRFKSNNEVVEFQKMGGKLVGIDGLLGWIKQDCPILKKYQNSWLFKLKRVLHLTKNT